MAFSEKTPASVALLMAEIVAFATASGGLTDAGTGSGGGYSRQALQSPSGAYITFEWLTSGATEIRVNTSTAWAGGTAILSQTGACPINTIWRTTSAPVKCWLFSDGYSTHVVINPTPAAYHHLSFGRLEKWGTYTGGEYVSAGYFSASTIAVNSTVFPHCARYSTVTASQNHVRCLWNSKATAVGVAARTDANLMWSGFSFASAAGGATIGTVNGEPIFRQSNSYNGRSVIMPHQYFIGWDNATAQAQLGWIPIGIVNNSGYINIDDLNAEDVINTDWMVFPVCMKNPVSPVLANLEVDTGVFGLAYKK